MRAILTYHSIDDSGSPVSLSREAFRRHVTWLASDAVDVVPLGAVNDQKDTRPAVAITFDDGFANLATDAWPLLAEHGLPATVFAVSRKMGTVNDWTAPGIPPIPTQPLMSWEQLGQLATSGLEVGAHTRTHADLTRISPDQMQDELAGAQEDIEQEIGVAPATFAYPYGRVSPPVEAAVRARYSLACTTEFRWLDLEDTATLLPRLDMYYYAQPGRLEAFGTTPFRARIRTRALVRALAGKVRSFGKT